MKLACADNTFRLLQPWEHAVELIRLLDLEAVDVCLMGNRSHLRPEEVRDDLLGCARRITEALAGRGLELSDLFVIPWTDFETMAPNHPDRDERARSQELFRDMLELAVRAGAPGMTILPGIEWPGEDREDSFQRAVEVLGVRAERVRAEGVRLSVEPHLGSIVQDPAQARRLCEEASGLELTLDYSHFVYQGIPQEEIDPLVAHARHAHARGAAHRRMQAPLAENVIDFERMVDAMREAGYGGDVGLEYLWLDWERLNECDTVSETILLRDRLRARLEGRPWTYPVSAI